MSDWSNKMFGNPCGTAQTDFPVEHRERNWEIYNARVVEKRTLGYLSKQYGISRERIRQIVFKGERITALRKWLKIEVARTDKTVLGSLTLSTRLRNALRNEIGKDWWVTDIADFCAKSTKEGMMRWPNLGKKSLEELHELLERVNPDAANLWAAGNGQNNNPPKHGRSGPRKRR